MKLLLPLALTCKRRERNVVLVVLKECRRRLAGKRGEASSQGYGHSDHSIRPPFHTLLSQVLWSTSLMNWPALWVAKA